ncbi:lipocalin family protein [Corynebacterium sp.]|uniref:lipocalin family protein n=1 Tax=Corynebacterium sp. TaxID=1720 RepID=UPI0019897BCB|nr:lipocalin family protein [Corynebacterium sp.]HHU67692.1 lipocalin family protein [Corynebacterium sp.]
MRRTALVLSTLALGAALLSPVAAAQDLFDGGRLSGGSTQILPDDLTLPGGQLPETDGAVDLGRFAGTWYQVAALPQPYSLQCAHNTTAEYGVIDDSTISVRNSCGTLFGGRSGIEGTATVRSDASLRVNFPGVPFQNPDGPVNYRVTHLEEDYSLAVVGDPNRLSGFVLSRTPDLSPEQWSRVRGIVESRGWNSCLFLTVPMEGGRGDVTPLCTQ